MHLAKFLVATALVAAVTVPVVAAIKAMNLRELMEITNDVVLGEVVGKTTFVDDHEMEGAVYTTLTVQGESLRNGEVGTYEVTFLGSHDPADEFVISEMPALQDVRLGGEVVLFTESQADFGGRNVAHSWANAYRVERSFGEPVVMGKGEGSAFPTNMTLVSVREQVRATSLAIEAAKQPALK